MTRETRSLFDGQINDQDAKMLLDAGVDVNAVDENGLTPLFRQCEAGNLPVVKLLLDAGADVNQPCSDESGMTPLFCAATEVIVRLLLKHGADINAESRDYKTPLEAQAARPCDSSKAIQEKMRIMALLIESGATIRSWGYKTMLANEQTLFNGRLSVEDAVALIEAGADVEALSEYGDTPLSCQCAAGNLDVVKLLIDSGADVNRPCAGYDGQRPIHFATTVDIVRLLIERGAEVDATDKDRETPLMIQARRCRTPDSSEFAQCFGIVELLIELGADVNARDENGRCVLEKASAYEVIKLLIDHGADATAVNNDGQSLLCYREDVRVIDLLAEHGASATLAAKGFEGRTPITLVRTAEAAEALIRHGADVNALSYDGNPALFDAWTPEVAMVLLKHGADVNGGRKIKQWGGEPPLFNYERTLELTREMLRRGADVNGRDDNGRTLLHMCHSVEEAELLLEFGADIHARARSWHHKTPLHIHCEGGCCPYKPENPDLYSAEDERVKIIRFLLEHGADVHVKDDKGRTPLYYCPSTDKEVLRLLKSYGADAWENYGLGE